MLSTLRDKKTMQVVLWGLVVAFVATIFIAWGAGSSLQRNNTDPNVVAKVGNENITYSDLDKVYQPELDRLYNTLGEAPNTDQIASLKKRALDSLIENSIMSQAAKKLGISVSDEELAASLQRLSYFKDDTGKFSKDKYLQILQANQITPAQFEASERSELLYEKVRSALADGVIYTSDELADYKSLLNREIKVQYLSLNPKDYENTFVVKEDDLKDFYENHKTEFDHPERLKVRHILLAAQGSSNPLDTDKAEKTLEDYRNQILSGKTTFATLARKYSQDNGSKNQGGDLGWVTRGEMVKEFEDAVFSAKKGEITKPFKTQYGYHIAQILDVEKEYKSTFMEVRSKVLDEYKKFKANQKTIEIADLLAQKIKDKENLSQAAKELNLKSGETLWFSQDKDIPGIKDSKQQTQELTSLYQGDWAGPIPINSKEYFFQLVDARAGKSEKGTIDPDVAQQFAANHQDSWLKNFIDQQKKILNVKTFLNG
jgi:peptidyl-prolyl cis-trans isomerase D